MTHEQAIATAFLNVLRTLPYRGDKALARAAMFRLGDVIGEPMGPWSRVRRFSPRVGIAKRVSS